MPSEPIHTGWNSVEDDEPSAVPVRVNVSPKASDAIAATSNEPEPYVPKTPEPTLQTNSRTMRLSAITGMSLVLVGIAFYVGIDNLRSSLTDGGNAVTTVTITQDGRFDPPAISLATGTELTIENKNENPQVLKVKEGGELFGSQVIFDQPFHFTVPTDISGIFTYFSETLPDDRTLLITVTPAIEAAVAPAEILLPPAEAPDLSIAPTISQENGTEMISVGSAPPSKPSTFDQSGIPTNPYTVGSAKDRNGSRTIAVTANNLHSGAPLLATTQHLPRSNVATGAATVWLALLPTLLGMVFVYRKMTTV